MGGIINKNNYTYCRIYGANRGANKKGFKVKNSETLTGSVDPEGLEPPAL